MKRIFFIVLTFIIISSCEESKDLLEPNLSKKGIERSLGNLSNDNRVNSLINPLLSEENGRILDNNFGELDLSSVYKLVDYEKSLVRYSIPIVNGEYPKFKQLVIMDSDSAQNYYFMEFEPDVKSLMSENPYFNGTISFLDIDGNLLSRFRNENGFGEMITDLNTARVECGGGGGSSGGGSGGTTGTSGPATGITYGGGSMTCWSIQTCVPDIGYCSEVVFVCDDVYDSQRVDCSGGSSLPEGSECTDQQLNAGQCNNLNPIGLQPMGLETLISTWEQNVEVKPEFENDPCLNNIWQKMKETDAAFKLLAAFTEQFPSDNLVLNASSDPALISIELGIHNAWGATIPSDGTTPIQVYINNITTQNASELFLATVLAHELLHAHIMSQLEEYELVEGPIDAFGYDINGLYTADLEEVYMAYLDVVFDISIPLGEIPHAMFARGYIDFLEDFIEEMDLALNGNNQNSDLYELLAWTGLNYQDFSELGERGLTESQIKNMINEQLNKGRCN